MYRQPSPNTQLEKRDSDANSLAIQRALVRTYDGNARKPKETSCAFAWDVSWALNSSNQRR